MYVLSKVIMIVFKLADILFCYLVYTAKQHKWGGSFAYLYSGPPTLNKYSRCSYIMVSPAQTMSLHIQAEWKQNANGYKWTTSLGDLYHASFVSPTFRFKQRVHWAWGSCWCSICCLSLTWHTKRRYRNSCCPQFSIAWTQMTLVSWIDTPIRLKRNARNVFLLN